MVHFFPFCHTVFSPLSLVQHLKTVGLGKIFESFKPIFDWQHGYCDILDIDGMCEVDLPSAFQWLLLQKKKRTD